jgi:membrane protein
VGSEAAHEIESIVQNFMSVRGSWLISICGLVFFVFVATTLLGVIKQNIHKVWRIKKAKIGITGQVRERGTLFGIIILTGVLFLITSFIDYSLAISLDYLQIMIPKFGILIIRVLNFLFSIIVVTIWFTILFKMLPAAKVNWDTAFNGAFLTAILYNAGKFILGKVLIFARIETIFGASASFALLLLFIFYCSFILYFGAAFTHQYAEHSNKHICASKYAHEYEEKLIGIDKI